MGRLYDACQFVIGEISAKGLDPFKSRGAIALETGFLVSMVAPNDPDDPEKLQALKDAALKVVGVTIP